MRSLILFISIVFFISSCTNHSGEKENTSSSEWQHLTGEAQGTTFSIKYEGEVEYSKEIKQLFIDIDMQLSTYVDSSIITKINNSNGNYVGSTPRSSFYVSVLSISKDVYYNTNGAFNPLVFPLVEYWGFGKKANEPDNIDSSRINFLLDFLNMDSLYLNIDDDEFKMHFNSNIKIDFNAIAQGYSVDVLAAFLEKQGVKNYMIEVGGEVIAKGKNDRGTFWKLGIDKPTDINAEHQLQAIIELKNRALATSGNYRKFYEKDGIRYSHTIDPKTGYPVQHSLLSATVLAPDCASADAYATAFMVMGVEKTKKFLKEHPELKLDAYLIYSEKKNFKTWFSSGLKDLIDEDLN